MKSPLPTDAALLGALFGSRGQRIPRQELAQIAGLSPDMLESHFAPYLEAGYPIQFHPQGGVSLLDPPDIWCAEEILGRCPPSGDPRDVRWPPPLLQETASTNDVARDQGRRGSAAGFVVAATRQTRGRGRLGRAWESATGCGLYVSILLRPGLTLAEAGRLTLLGSVAAASAVETLTGLRPRIKWPNDLFIGDRKLGGILIETEPSGTRVGFAVIGIGLNVNHAAEDFSPAVRDLATSLRLATGTPLRRADLLVALLHAFTRQLRCDFSETRATWAASSLTLGQRVTLTTARGVKHGQALGLDDSGALLLRNDAGEIETITAGDMRAV